MKSSLRNSRIAASDCISDCISDCKDVTEESANPALISAPDAAGDPATTLSEAHDSEVHDSEVHDKDMGEAALASARLLWASRVWLGYALLIGLAAGAIIALSIPSRYESSVQLMPPDSQSTNGMAMLAALAAKSGSGVSALAGDALGVKSSGSLFIGILRSRTVEDRLVARFQLKKIYRARLDEDARRQLLENTGASEDRKSGIINLTVTDRDRQRAQAMAMAYVEELNRLVAELSTSSAHRERVFLEERLATVKQDLDRASHQLGEFSSRNATIDVQAQGHTMVEAAAALQGQLIAAETERQSLETIYSSNNARVRAVQAQVSELRSQLQKLGGANEEADAQASGQDNSKISGKDNIKIKDSGNDSGIGKANPDSLYPSLRQLPLLGVQYAELYRQAKIEEAVFETLTQQFEIAKVQEAKETPSVKVLDDASLPERHSFPPRTMIALFGGFVALAGSAFWLLARERWERTSALDSKKQFAEEVFRDVNSMMPWATPNGSRWQAASHRVWIRFANRAPALSAEDPHGHARDPYADHRYAADLRTDDLPTDELHSGDLHAQDRYARAHQDDNS